MAEQEACASCKTDVDVDDLTELESDKVKLCTVCFELNELAHEVGGTDTVRGLLDKLDALFASRN